MTVINTRITVTPDGAISTATPLAAGEYEATITAAHPTPLSWPGKPFNLDAFPIHLEPWDETVSLRREDMYDDGGRLR